jgi:hypothetical protein
MTALTHQVFFRLKHDRGSAAEREFLRRSAVLLAGIPGVQDFQVLEQVSPKSDFTHGFSMRFADAEAYAAYNGHPVHVAYVTDIWLAEVAAFQELDSVRADGPSGPST